VNPIFESVLAALTKHVLALLRKIMARKKIPKSSNFSLRVEDEQRAKLQAAANVTAEGDTSVVLRACIRAYIEAFERDGEVPNPLAIISKSKLRALESAHAPPAFHTPTFPSTARPPQDVHSVNESAPTADAVPPIRTNTPAQPVITKTRRGIRGMIAKEKGKL